MLNKKKVAKIMGRISFEMPQWWILAACRLPLFRQSLHLPPRGNEWMHLFLWRCCRTCVQKPLHHKDLSLPNINKVYDPDLNVPLVLIVLHKRWRGEKISERKEEMNRQAVDQHPYEFVVWHHHRAHKSPNSSYPFSAPCSKLLFHHWLL